MLFESLSEREKQAIREAINAILVSPDIYPDECHTRYGVQDRRMKLVLRQWPNFDERDPDTRLTIGGCLNEVCHGIAFEDDPDVVGMAEAEWLNWFSVSREEMRLLFEKWRRLVSR
jgi:hypothetical protein